MSFKQDTHCIRSLKPNFTLLQSNFFFVHFRQINLFYKILHNILCNTYIPHIMD